MIRTLIFYLCTENKCQLWNLFLGLENYIIDWAKNLPNIWFRTYLLYVVQYCSQINSFTRIWNICVVRTKRLFCLLDLDFSIPSFLFYFLNRTMQTLRLQNFPSYLLLIQKQVQLVILCTNFRHVYMPNRI